MRTRSSLKRVPCVPDGVESRIIRIGMALARLPRLKCVKVVATPAGFALTMLLGAAAASVWPTGRPDTLAWWWLDRRLAFDDAQAPRARRALTQWLDWHRRHPLALAEDVALIEEIAREASADTGRTWLCRWWQRLRERQQSASADAGRRRDGRCAGRAERGRGAPPAAGARRDNRDWRERFVRGAMPTSASARLARAADRPRRDLLRPAGCGAAPAGRRKAARLALGCGALAARSASASSAT